MQCQSTMGRTLCFAVPARDKTRCIKMSDRSDRISISFRKRCVGFLRLRLGRIWQGLRASHPDAFREPFQQKGIERSEFGSDQSVFQLHRGWVWLPLALANVLIALTVLLFSVQVMVGHNPNVVGPLAILLRFLGTTT